MPQIGNVTRRPHPALRRGPVYMQRGYDSPPRYILAPGPEVDHKLLLSYAHRDTFGGVLPPGRLPPDRPPAEAGGTQGSLLPPQLESGNSPPPRLIPFTLGPPGT